VKYDVFISHASEDKEAFVRPLAQHLSDQGVNVWYDEFELKPGAKLSRSIDRGLSDSRHGVVVLSPSFFGKGWPERELGGLVARDIDTPGVIIPIWHEITKADVLSYSAPLADIIALSSALGAEVVAGKLSDVVCGPVDEVTRQMRRAASLLKRGEFHTSVLAAAHGFESFAKTTAISRLGYAYFTEKPIHTYSLGPMLRLLSAKGLLKLSKGKKTIDIGELIGMRNSAVHTTHAITIDRARWFLESLATLIDLNSK
jgi:hypothetical protein